MPLLRGGLNNQTFLPPLLYRRISIPSSQVLTLLASPVLLVPAIPNKNIVPDGIQYFIKSAGVAYSNAAVTDLRGGFTLSVTNRWLEVAAALLTGFTDVTTQSILLLNNQRNSVNPQGDTGGLFLTTSGGEFAGGTGDLVAFISYRVYEISNLIWF